MKKYNFITLILILFLGVNLLYSCKKDDSSFTEAAQEVTKSKYIVIAQSWYNTNKNSLNNSELNFPSLTVNWNQYTVDTIANTKMLITVPIYSRNDKFYREMALVTQNDSVLFGLIKEYTGNPFKEKTSLNIYNNSGILLTSAIYNGDESNILHRSTWNETKFLKVALVERMHYMDDVTITGYIPPKNNFPNLPNYDLNYYIPSWPSGYNGGGSGMSSPPNSTSDFNMKIDDTDLPDCIKSILSSLKKISGNSVADIIQKFSGEVPSYNWKLKTVEFSSNYIFGSTNNYNVYTHTASTFINFNDHLKNHSSDLAIAKTILHEAVHAELSVRFAKDYPNVKKEYPELFNWWKKKKDQNYAQHDVVFPDLVKDIAESLKQYGESRGYILDEQVYKDLAWGGLEGTDAFKGLDPNDQRRIINRIKAEALNEINGSIKQEGNKNDCTNEK